MRRVSARLQVSDPSRQRGLLVQMVLGRQARQERREAVQSSWRESMSGRHKQRPCAPADRFDLFPCSYQRCWGNVMRREQRNSSTSNGQNHKKATSLER